MSFKKYLLDKSMQIFITISGFIITILLLNAFKVERDLILVISIIFIIVIVLNIFFDYYKRNSFYRKILNILSSLDKKYLVLEMINKPNFYEGELFYQMLYDINKSMCETVKEYSLNINDFKEFVEMWIHEVKIPISSLILLNHNHSNEIDRKYVEQIRRLDNYVDQILYYVRSENAEKDYLIKDTELSKVIKNVGLKNMVDLLENKVDYNVENVNVKVLTDSKWLEFILGQIINNCIKYKRDINNSYIKISVRDEKYKTTLIIEDNGIGIKASDLKQVFDKSFTGENGRNTSKSTGMGLFIAKNMCSKLGHKINIESKENEYTRVYITFAKDKYYEVLK